jgi:glucose-6-phosphate isomerase
MQLQYFNCPPFQKLTADKLPRAEFLSYVCDLDRLNQIGEQYQQYKNILVVGHGGSITSFQGIYGALREKATKQAYFLSTVDPDYIYELRKQLDPAETLVLAISKSGETTTQIEALLQFAAYPILFVTGKTSPLAAIADKLNKPVIEHPPIGGRYTGLTEVGLLPAILCGLDAAELHQGGKNFYQQYRQENIAWQAASILYQLENSGYVDVFLPVYSTNLFPFTNLIVQLCHESFGKDGKGQTYFAAEAPESQHHTNQRFFGGRANVAALALSVENFLHPLVNQVPHQLHSVHFKNEALFSLNKIPLEVAMNFEREGVMEDARLKNIPLLHLNLAEFKEYELGQFISFWQLYAVYASVLRGVDPFDQPEVENSKKISFAKRLQFKGLL